MIRTKSYILREIKRLEKRKKKLEIELSTARKIGEVFFKISGEVIQKEIMEIGGQIKAHNWTAFTSEKNLPKIKSKSKKKPDEK